MNRRFIKKLILTETGATAIEYGLIVALIAVATMGALTTMTSTFVTNFDATSSSITNAMDSN